MTDTYQVNATQLQDIADYMVLLDEADTQIDEREHPELKLGEGGHALIRGPIPVYTDSSLDPGVLGWLVKYDELGWRFTQTDPNPKKLGDLT